MSTTLYTRHKTDCIWRSFTSKNGNTFAIGYPTDRYYEGNLDQLLENNTMKNTDKMVPKDNAEWQYLQHGRRHQGRQFSSAPIESFRLNHNSNTEQYKYDMEFTSDSRLFSDEYTRRSRGTHLVFHDEFGDEYICNLPFSQSSYEHYFCLSYNSKKPNITAIYQIH